MQEDKQLSFDKWQFAGKRARAVSAETGIAHSDYLTMHLDGHDRKGLRSVARSAVPAWALDNKKFAAVVKLKVWRYLHYGLRMPEITLEELNRQVLERSKQVREWSVCENLSAYQRSICEAHLRTVDAPGGFAATLTKIAWCAYRMQMDSVEVAKEIGIQPTHVRATLQRLNKVARILFPEDVLPKNERLAKAGSAAMGNGWLRRLYRFNGPLVDSAHQG